MKTSSVSAPPPPLNYTNLHMVFYARSVHGDVVWVQVRTDERMMALLEADRQLMGQEIATANQLITGG